MLTRTITREFQRMAAMQKRHCGLLAAIDWRSSSDSPILTNPAVLEQATATMTHRGPDGRHTATGTLGNKKWAMGHQRLAIVDPNSRAADMPFLLEFNTPMETIKLKLVANGEIYNHEQLYNTLVEKHGWTQQRISHSDCEVIGHACACLGPKEAVKHLDGMFAFATFTENDKGEVTAFAARDPVGIKPLYYGNTLDGGAYMFASELKALVGLVDPSSVTAIPPGHYWTPDTGLVRYHKPDWLFDPNFAPWEHQQQPSDDEIRDAFRAAVSKRMMADVDYGFFLSGGVDSCIVSHVLLPMYRAETGDDRPIPAFTVGMEDSPDMQAAVAMVDALGGSRYIDHRTRTFTGSDVFSIIPKIVYHMETYEAELIRSAIPNWLLAERAGSDVKMVLTGEGADELFAGYLYFMDAETPGQIQGELKRIYSMLGDINLHRTDRMTMAHGLEARVPFLDTKFTELAMSLNPALKIVDREAVAKNAEGREKTFLRNLFKGPNTNNSSIPRPVLWRAKAMQCEGVGEDWVSQLQRQVAAKVSDAELANAAIKYPLNTPHTKEELYYRRLFDECFSGMAHVVNPWEGGCRAAGAAWESNSYTREGLANTNVLTHAFQKKSNLQTRSYSTQRRPFSAISAQRQKDEFMRNAIDAGYGMFESFLTVGGDDRSMINIKTGTNKYHIKPQPISKNAIFRGSCTCNSPTERGYQAAKKLFTEFEFASNGELDNTLQTVFDGQRRRIAACLELPDGVEIILCPSGSDAEYIPIAIARALKPSAEKIVNIVTQLKEIGAGSSVASGGAYFSTHAPLTGRLPDGVSHLEGFDGVSEISIPARERDGSVLDASAMAEAIARQAEQEGAYPIIHGVFGGKTGLRDTCMPPSRDGGKSSMGVIDACQGRFSLAELHEWLAQDSIVLFTASKFYQAPPFCGAVFVPRQIADQLRKLPPPAPLEMFGHNGLGGFLSDKELPECMNSWKPLLRSDIKGNVGLALRWEAGLAGMEALSSTPDDQLVQAVEEWASRVTTLVQAQPGLDAWCVERSIVSIRLEKSSNGSWLDMNELKDIYRYMSLDVSGAVPRSATAEERAALAVCCNLGQPVDVADSHAILRIALGSESLAKYIVDPEETLKEDQIVVQKLGLVAKYLQSLQNSNL
jgi:asparagine synthase (glutamine-hydrolysing)